MAKEKFNWKSLFVNEETDTKQSSSNTSTFPKEETSNTKFPNSTASVNSPVTSNQKVDGSVLSGVLKMYESGFDSLNMPGYDFFEFFKAIKAVNSNDPSVYKMAMTMAQSSDPKVTKDSLLKGAVFYVDEINKVHKQYEDKGTTKREQIKSNQLKEKDKLSSEISTLEKQILELQTKISNKKKKLEATDGNLLSEVSSIEQKIVANDMAKTKILNSITDVMNGIKNNL